MKPNTIKATEVTILVTGGASALSAFIYDEGDTIWHVANAPYVLMWALWLWSPYAAVFGISSWLRRTRPSLGYSLLALAVALIMLGYTAYKCSYVLRGKVSYWFFNELPAFLWMVVAVAMALGTVIVKTVSFHRRRA